MTDNNVPMMLVLSAVESPVEMMRELVVTLELEALSTGEVDEASGPTAPFAAAEGVTRLPAATAL
jgi:hypothetical protein